MKAQTATRSAKKPGRPPSDSPLSRLRLRLGWSQDDLAIALRAALGWGSIRQIVRWETGELEIPRAVLNAARGFTKKES